MTTVQVKARFFGFMYRKTFPSELKDYVSKKYIVNGLGLCWKFYRFVICLIARFLTIVYLLSFFFAHSATSGWVLCERGCSKQTANIKRPPNYFARHRWNFCSRGILPRSSSFGNKPCSRCFGVLWNCYIDRIANHVLQCSNKYVFRGK